MNSPPRKKAKMLTGEYSDAADENVDDKTERDEQEQVLLALMEHRTKEVERNKLRVTHYTAEVFGLNHGVSAIRDTKLFPPSGKANVKIKLWSLVTSFFCGSVCTCLRGLVELYGKNNFCLIHVSLIPVLGVVGEQKTKPTQHSVRELRALGLTPHFLACRSAQVAM